MANVSDHLYRTLKRNIISGQYAPGSRLREEHLAQAMSVSRTPVRAALARLAAEGLLQQQGRATLVASWTDWDIEEIFSLRLMLEAHGAGLAAERASAEEIDAMDAINDEMRHWAASGAEDRLAKVQEANRRFHHAILEAARSGRLRGILGSYLDIPQMIGSFYFYSDQDILSSVDHHRQIVAAIRNRNASLAQAAMQFHLQTSLAHYRNARRSKLADSDASPETHRDFSQPGCAGAAERLSG